MSASVDRVEAFAGIQRRRRYTTTSLSDRFPSEPAGLVHRAGDPEWGRPIVCCSATSTGYRSFAIAEFEVARLEHWSALRASVKWRIFNPRICYVVSWDETGSRGA